jgi:ketosteroid isomerase-like protein
MTRNSLRAALAALCIAAFAPVLRAQTSDPAAILQVLADQQNAWNRGDIVTFMHGYNDSPDTTFIGRSVEHGYQPILARYQRTYATQAAMGILKFSNASVRMLGTDHAVVVGQFHLERTAAGGGDAQGIFSLIFEKEPGGWKIILDHTSTT